MEFVAVEVAKTVGTRPLCCYCCCPYHRSVKQPADDVDFAAAVAAACCRDFPCRRWRRHSISREDPANYLEQIEQRFGGWSSSESLMAAARNCSSFYCPPWKTASCRNRKVLGCSLRFRYFHLRRRPPICWISFVGCSRLESIKSLKISSLIYIFWEEINWECQHLGNKIIFDFHYCSREQITQTHQIHSTFMKY